MENLKQEAIKAISKLPESANIDDIMYELYVIDKVKKGRESAERGDTISVQELKNGQSGSGLNIEILNFDYRPHTYTAREDSGQAGMTKKNLSTQVKNSYAPALCL